MIELRTLGSVDIADAAGRDLSAVLRQPKRVALLLYLAIAGRSGYVRRDKLVALFWPELEPENARGALRASLHRLRLALGPNAIASRGAEDVRLGDDAVQSDLSRMHQAADAGDDRAVLALYRGEFLDGFFVSGSAAEFDQWIDDERRGARVVAMRAARRLSERLSAEGRDMEAATAAARAVEIAPEDEHAMRMHLQLLIRAGNHAAAMTAYEAFRLRLLSDLQTEPSPETRAVVDSLRVVGASADGPTVKQGPVPSIAAARWRPSTASRHPVRRSRAAVAVIVVLAFAWTWTLVRPTPAAGVAHASWNALATEGVSPFPRWKPAVVLDSTSRSVLLFGGREASTNLADVWRGTFDSGSVRWSRIRTQTANAESPGGLWLTATAYNARSDRMILFGGSSGYTSPCSDELWILSNVSGRAGEPAWHRIPRHAAWPAARADHRVVYDAASNRLMLFGGHDCIAPVFNDYWILRNADGTTGTPTWERVAPDTSEGAPRGPRGFAMAYNPASNRVIVTGGYDHPTATFFGETWVLTNANAIGGRPAWKLIHTSGEQPKSRINAAYGYDAATNRLVVAFGEAPSAQTDAWVLVGADGTTPDVRWRRLALSGAVSGAGIAAGVAFDAIGNQLFVFGGAGESRAPQNWVLRNATTW